MTIGSLEAAKNIFLQKASKNICTLHLQDSVIRTSSSRFKDLQDSVQRSLQNPAEKILQICTDSQISKTWDGIS